MQILGPGLLINISQEGFTRLYVGLSNVCDSKIESRIFARARKSLMDAIHIFCNEFCLTSFLSSRKFLC